MRQWLERKLAIYRVWRGHAQRICAPGHWVVWREGDAVKSRNLGRSATPN